ncbi:glycerophosphodiester phosphodiesterase [Paenibacillus ginsengarvi]|uniref:Glycerophosphodiester phosphodiesterase n=1 Tax=Paenibacillus ginsengarvi TaxID=400777 RepID=A0A3B0BIY9_9BACL|nr:glycerophosphodiester phosphodiesterase family protein [Paenibacillus ginsengarvi]RKN72379.1 glycerophosphodiester phosphodiesterase [Paenibacillus ginsengarvi]
MTKQTDTVYWQAHRGGGAYEAPDNTMAANRYAWELGGIPEADIRTTRDGVIVCLHDSTPARTTTAPEAVSGRAISEFDYAETAEWDAGVKFDVRFAGERIPSLEQLFAEMQGKPERLAYLDLKQVDLADLGALIDRYGVNEQCIFTHNVQANCRQMKQIAAGVKSMLWIGGNPERIKRTYAEQARDLGFDGLDQVQFHLHDNSDGDWPYAVDREFLEQALAETRAAGVDLEVLPFRVDEHAIHLLLDLGIRWFATDEPARFLSCVRSWQSLK